MPDSLLVIALVLICVASSLKAWLNTRDPEASEPTAGAQRPEPPYVPAPGSSWPLTRGENFLARREIDRPDWARGVREWRK